MKMSSNPQAGNVSSGTRLVAIESNATNRPSLLMEIPWLGLPQLATEPSFASETTLVVGVHPAGTPVQVSRTYTFPLPLTFCETKLVAPEPNATSRPSALMGMGIGVKVVPFGCEPLVVRSTRIVLGVHGGVAPMQVSRQ